MADLRIPVGLWDTARVPEGVLVKWFYADGAKVAAGAKVAEIMVEKTSFEIAADVGGMLRIKVVPDGVVKPGAVIAEIVEGT